MNKNYSIKCDVQKCRHNYSGSNCQLESIKVACCDCGEQCTCCASYEEK